MSCRDDGWCSPRKSGRSYIPTLPPELHWQRLSKGAGIQYISSLVDSRNAKILILSTCPFSLYRNKYCTVHGDHFSGAGAFPRTSVGIINVLLYQICEQWLEAIERIPTMTCKTSQRQSSQKGEALSLHMHTKIKWPWTEGRGPLL